MKKHKGKIIAGFVLGVIIVVFAINSCKKNVPTFSFETAKVVRGTVNNSVTATGTIQALKTVAVGTQVSGVINKLYADFNSEVKKGELLAELDKTPLLAQLDNAQASLDDANSEVTYQTANYNRIKALHDKSLVAQSDYDLALYNFNKAQTTLKMAKSNYSKSKINLDYATIYSPIDGVVLNRAVDEGQTVAASFSTPTLFSIAKELTKMQVAANIDEADIGQIKDGQLVEFSVDAFPDMKFTGTVTEIRLQSTTTSNVVTYTVIVQAPNPEKKLMPGMTANITIIIEKSDNVLIVPGKALRFKADSSMMDAYIASLPENERFKIADGAGPAGMKPMGPMIQTPPSAKIASPISTIWVKKGPALQSVPVETGINDGINAEAKTGLKEGDEVVISMTSSGPTDVKKAASNPFMPKRPGAKK
jgi:HlyD family secretion protein